MRKHGWQLPYHPLQVVAIAVVLALGFAFYVFFLPFVGKKVFQYVVLGLYTPLVACVFSLYVWCAATDPGDPGVFRSKKYLNIEDSGKDCEPKNFKQGSSVNEEHAATGNKQLGESTNRKKLSDQLQMDTPDRYNTSLAILLCWLPKSFMCSCFHSPAREQSSEQHTSEDAMFYCSLCEVEVLKNSKHCRVCDKCVDGFDHHCRWLNNCIGRRNYGRFFVLMISALLLLILQWSIGVLVLILCFMEHKRFSVEISAKLGSSFSLVPFIIVVASCTFLAMIATLPLAQLFFFHVLLIKKGISTYDYIVALREQDQEQQGVGQQSPQISSASSFTGMSSASSFTAFRRDAWCTPPRLFLEDHFDVIPPEVGISLKSTGKKMMMEESTKKRNTSTVKINPWTLARLNAEEVSKAAEQAKRKSKILQPITRRETPQGHETDSSFGSNSERIIPRIDNNKRRSGKTSNRSEKLPEMSTNLAPLQLAARSAFRTSRAMSSSGITASSPDSSLGSPDLHPFRVSSYGREDSRGLMPIPSAESLLRSTSSDGYEASGGEDSDRVPSRIVHRSFNWSNLLFNSGRGDMADGFKASSSSNGLPANVL